MAKESIRHNKKTIKFMLDERTIPMFKMRLGVKVPHNIKKQDLIEMILKKEKLDDEPETTQNIPDKLSGIEHL